MSWTDEEIDKLFGDAAGQQTFEYKPEYWNDIAKQLPVNKSRKPLIWWFTGSMFLLVFVGWTVMETAELNTEQKEGLLNADQSPTYIEKSTAKGKLSSTEKEEQSNGPEAGNQMAGSSDQFNAKNLTPNTSRDESFKVVQLPRVVEPIVAFNDQLYSPIETLSPVEKNETLESELNPSALENENNETQNEASITLPLIDVLGIEKPYQDLELLPSSLLGAKVSKIGYYMELNGGVGQSWMRSEDNSVNGSAGISGGIVLPVNEFKLKVGLGFQATKFDDLKIKERTIIYGFGSSILENTYEFNSIYALTIPVEVNYSFGRHTLSAGVTSSLNLFTRLNRIEKIDGEETSFRSGVAGVDLFSRVGIQPNLGYSYAVNENMAFGLRIGVNSVQPIRSDRFIGTPIELPVDGQIFIMRTFKF